MTMEQLRKAIRAVPFKPFTICLADGQKLPVPHPECVAIGTGATRTVAAADGEEYRIIDLFLVTSLDSTHRKVPRTRRSR